MEERPLKSEHILKAVLLGLITAALLSWAAETWREDQVDNELARHGVTVCRFGPDADQSSRALIQLGLILSLAGCYIKGPIGKLQSLVALLWISENYVTWWKFYFELEERSGDEAHIRHLFFLYDGSWLDLFIAASLPILIIWQVCVLASSISKCLPRNLR